MCDTLGFLTKGTSYFAKNSDRSPNEPQVLEWIPHRNGGKMLQLLYTQIPDADARAVLISRPTWMWGAEMGINEAGRWQNGSRLWEVLGKEKCRLAIKTAAWQRRIFD